MSAQEHCATRSTALATCRPSFGLQPNKATHTLCGFGTSSNCFTSPPLVNHALSNGDHRTSHPAHCRCLLLSCFQTRTITAYRFPHWGSAHVYGIALQHFAIDEGFDIPLFNNVFSVITEVSSERLSAGQDVFDVFYITTASTKGANESLLATARGPNWRGEVVVLRRAKVHNGYVNLRPGDRARAVTLVFRYENSALTRWRY